MTDRRVRTGTRRDEGIRTISTSSVRYPGLRGDLADSAPEQPGEPSRTRRRGLDPDRVRDTGIALGQGRRTREGARRKRVRRQRTAAIIVVAAFSALLVFEFVSAYTANAARTRAKVVAESTPSAPVVGTTRPVALLTESPLRFLPAAPVPTPVFAYWRGLKLHLPVPTKKLTEIGFHQASYTYALHMKTQLPDASMTKARGHGTRDYTTSPLDSSGKLDVSVLRMWRLRPGRPDSAADVGALPGTPILAPVDGVVVKIKPYKLYGKWFDYEVHIKPDGFDNVDVVMIHVDQPQLKVDDRVTGGVTQIGVVRRLSNKLTDQLAEFEPAHGKAKGDHVHVQLNNVNDPTYHGLDGVTD